MKLGNFMNLPNKKQKNSILETTTLAKKKYIGNYYTKKYLACLPHQYQTKEKKLRLSIT